jgi:hypothetical protein
MLFADVVWLEATVGRLDAEDVPLDNVVVGSGPRVAGAWLEVGDSLLFVAEGGSSSSESESSDDEPADEGLLSGESGLSGPSSISFSSFSFLSFSDLVKSVLLGSSACHLLIFAAILIGEGRRSW